MSSVTSPQPDRPSELADSWADLITVSMPWYLDPDGGPVADLTAGERKAFGVVRRRPFGVVTKNVASGCGLSVSRAQKCLKQLQDRKLIKRSTEAVMWGYGTCRAQLWRLTYNERCLEVMMYLPWAPEPEQISPPDRVPPEFWSRFWSGTHAAKLRIPDHALLIATTLIGERSDPCAQAWALSYLPVETLKECRTLRGYDIGLTANWLDRTIRERCDGC